MSHSRDDRAEPPSAQRPGSTQIADWCDRAFAARPELANERSVVFHDLGLQHRRFEELKKAFPPAALHAVAIKANPIVEVLRRLVAQGAGLEAASIEEVHIALAAGCPPQRIVFDSPAKTVDELRFALERGMTVNVDNADELRAAVRVERHPESRLGLRINPARGVGTIAATSVAGPESRFGFDIDELVDHVLPTLPEDARIDGLHVHVGSQGCDLEQLVEAVVVAEELRPLIASRQSARRTFVDVGGGLPTDYGENADSPSFADYAQALRVAVPQLWNEGALVTEFGRALLAGCGVAVSAVEYVKRVRSGQRVAVIHLGADFLLRAAYAPTSWPYRFSKVGTIDEPPSGNWEVAGPLCFAGDVIGRSVPLPDLAPGDRLAVHDVGAYSISMWSRHCSRGIPIVVGVESDGEFTTLLAPERPEDLAAFWSRVDRSD